MWMLFRLLLNWDCYLRKMEFKQWVILPEPIVRACLFQYLPRSFIDGLGYATKKLMPRWFTKGSRSDQIVLRFTFNRA